MTTQQPLQSPNTRRALVIGAGGAMTSSFLKSLARWAPDDLRFDLRDIDPQAAERSRALVGGDRAVAGALDLFDTDGLAQAVAGAAFVINGAGPFHRTAGVARRAAIAARVPYLDIDDDVESTLDAKTLHLDAVEAGIPLFIGCGASPGLTNVLARDLIDRVDVAEQVDVAWCVGDEGPIELGRSVLGHTLHMGAGRYTGWRGGRSVQRTSYATTRRLPLPRLERQSFYECAHPEPVMLGTSFPQLVDATCWGSIHPGPLNGLIKGIAEAEADGRIGYDDAIDFLRDVIAGKPTSKTADTLAMQGVRGQLRRGEISRWEYWNFIAHVLLKRQFPTEAATAALVTGHLNGRRVELLRYIDSTPSASPLKRMEISTGCAQSAFFLEILDGRANQRSGVLFPEQWVDPARFYHRFDQTMPAGAGDWLGPVLVRPADGQGKASSWQPLHELRDAA